MPPEQRLADSHIAGENAGPALPPLRQDIELHAGGRALDGSPTWVLVDPASGAYFHIGWLEFAILSRWQLGRAASIASAIADDTTLAVSLEQVEAVRHFFAGNGLLRGPGSALAQKALAALEKQKALSISGLLQRMLYTRVPLFNPRRLLDILTPLAAPLFRRSFWCALAALFLIALYLLGRQWSAFSASVNSIASLDGAASIAAILFAAKIAHELGHAITATRFGADVPVMGVSFVLGVPMLYTETSAAWTLSQRRQRIVIASAGVAAETILAVAAMLAWSLLEPGALRTASAFATTTLIVLTLAVNANPLMRFDGYFVLAEALGVDNLQTRAFQCVHWRLGRLFAGSLAPEPEPELGQVQRSILESYGFAVLLYRVVVYSGIVYALDRMLFPALAVPLAAGVILLFVVKPLMLEIRSLCKIALARRDAGSLARFALVVGALAALVLLPWRTTITIPVIFEAEDTFDIYAPEPAHLAQIAARQGASVSRNQLLFSLDAPDIDQKLARTRSKVAALDRILDQRLTGDSYRDSSQVDVQELAKAQAELIALEQRRAKLTLRAPAGGVLTMVDPGLWPGLPIAPDRPLAQLVTTGTPRVVGYAEERDLAALGVAAGAAIWLDGVPDVSYSAIVGIVFTEATRTLDHPILATQYGGPIAARPGSDRGLVPETGIYKVVLTLVADRAGADIWPKSRTRGFARIDTPPRNLVSRIWLRLSGLVHREFG